MLFSDIRDANDTDGDALRRTRFVRLEEGGAMLEPCQMPGSCVDDASTRRAEWERQSRFAGVFEPWPGCSRAAPSLRYNNRLNIDGLLWMRGRKNGAYVTILLSLKTRRLLSASRLCTFSSTYTVPSQLWHRAAGSRASSTIWRRYRPRRRLCAAGGCTVMTMVREKKKKRKINKGHMNMSFLVVRYSSTRSR